MRAVRLANPKRITISACNVDSHGNHKRLANIYLEALPAQIIIQNSRGFDFAPHYENPAMQLIRINPKLDLDGPQLDVAAYRPGLLRYEIGTENVFIPDGGSGVTDRGFPQQLWPYVANRVEAEGPPTAGVWRTNQVVCSKRSYWYPRRYGRYCYISMFKSKFLHYWINNSSRWRIFNCKKTHGIN